VSGSEKRTVVEQILARLKERGWLSTEIADASADDFSQLTEGLRIRDLIEFERVVHAEMSAITDAARRGATVQDGYLYTTTFPCHECTRHVIAAGIRRLVYIEPYPKSLAARLHDDAIEIDRDDPPETKLRFEPFVGVAPRRYLELFTAGPDDRKAEGKVRPPQPGWLPKVLPPSPPEPTPESEPAKGGDDERGS
jgi:deoxycytidylate deaminase